MANSLPVLKSRDPLRVFTHEFQRKHRIIPSPPTIEKAKVCVKRSSRYILTLAAEARCAHDAQVAFKQLSEIGRERLRAKYGRYTSLASKLPIEALGRYPVMQQLFDAIASDAAEITNLSRRSGPKHIFPPGILIVPFAFEVAFELPIISALRITLAVMNDIDFFIVPKAEGPPNEKYNKDALESLRVPYSRRKSDIVKNSDQLLTHWRHCSK